MELHVKFLKLILASAVLAACNVTERVENNLPSSVVVGPDLIQGTLEAASERYPENKTLFDASVAQVVFPKIVKAGLLFGGTYGEGYLVRDGIVLSQVRLAGGNAGLNAGAQSYSQVVYILDDDTLAAFRRGGKLSLHGTLNYARQVTGLIEYGRVERLRGRQFSKSICHTLPAARVVKRTVQ